MRCAACDKILNDFELTRRFSESNEFVDMCLSCSKFLEEDDITVQGNLNFAHLSDIEEGFYVENGPVDYHAGTEYGEEDDLW